MTCLEHLAQGEVSACGRNWYLTEARLVEGLIDLSPSPFMVKKRIYTGSLYDLFLLLTCMVDCEKAQDVWQTARFHFTDTNEIFILQVMNAIENAMTFSINLAKLKLLISIFSSEMMQFRRISRTCEAVQGIL